MKKTLFIIFCITILSLPNALSQVKPNNSVTKDSFTNPLNVQFGDPYVLYSYGIYYMYGTGGVDKGFGWYSSPDLVNWKPEGQVYFHNNKNGWSDPTASWGGATGATLCRWFCPF